MQAIPPASIEAHAGLPASRIALHPARLQKIPLPAAPNSGRFIAHFLKQRFEFTVLQRADQTGIVGFNSKLIDRHRQFKITIQIDHFSVLQNLPASVGEFFPGSRVFHLVDVVQQWFQPAELANQCRGGFAAQSDPGDVIHRIARQREHIADKFWRDLPFCAVV